MFERFTDESRRVVIHASEEARRLIHNYIGTEHLLLGLIVQGKSTAADALSSLGITHTAVDQQVLTIIGLGRSAMPAHIPYTPRCKKVLELALREALKLDAKYIEPGHLLLGLAREGEGVAAQILTELGAPPDLIRQRVLSLIESPEPVLPPVVIEVPLEPGLRRQAFLRCRQLSRGLILPQSDPLEKFYRQLDPQKGPVILSGTAATEILNRINALYPLTRPDHPLRAVSQAIQQARQAAADRRT